MFFYGFNTEIAEGVFKPLRGISTFNAFPSTKDISPSKTFILFMYGLKFPNNNFNIGTFLSKVFLLLLSGSVGYLEFTSFINFLNNISFWV